MMTTPTDKLAELREKLSEYQVKRKDGLTFKVVRTKEDIDDIVHVIATYLEQIVAEQWPEEKRGRYTYPQTCYSNGFNEALDQTAALHQLKNPERS